MIAARAGGRRRFLRSLGTAISAVLASSVARAAGAVLPTPRSLAEELSKAIQAGQPLVVMVSLDGCPFCRVARDSYLDPLRRQEHVPVVQVDMGRSTALQTFGGVATSHGEMVKSWKVKIAPTVLFFGPGGKEVAQRLEGGYIADFYGAYLNERMLTARHALKAE